MADLTSKDVCVLLPAFNEAGRIERVASQIAAQGFPLFIFDDGSTDATPKFLKASSYPHLISDSNRGKGAAIRASFDWFLKTDYRAAVMMDADGQHDPAELPRFLEALNAGADVVVGNRMANPAGMPLDRRLTNSGLSALISLVALRRIPDSQCGYRALRREALEKIRLATAHYEIETEILLEAAKRDLRIDSIPVRSVYGDGKSQIQPIRDTLRFIKFISSYLIFRRFSKTD